VNRGSYTEEVSFFVSNIKLFGANVSSLRVVKINLLRFILDGVFRVNIIFG
jgi:hypothetical protein